MSTNKKILSSIRVQKLLEGEKSHSEKEIEHERVVNQQCNSADIEQDNEMISQIEEVEITASKYIPDEGIQLPSRAITISNAHLYDPITYFSKTSKLNPENSFISNRAEALYHEIDGTKGAKRKIFDEFVDGQNKRHIKMPSSPIMRPTSSNSLISPVGRQSPNHFNPAKKRPRTSSTSSVSSTASFNQMGPSKVVMDSGNSPKKSKIGMHFAIPYPHDDSKINLTHLSNSITTDKVILLPSEPSVISPVAMSIDSLKQQSKQLQPLNLSYTQDEFNKMSLGNTFPRPNGDP